MLVAPVVEKARLTWEVYLPEGSSWEHLWSGKVYKGGESVKVRAEIGKTTRVYKPVEPRFKKSSKEILSIPVKWKEMLSNVLPCLNNHTEANKEGYASQDGEKCFVIPSYEI